MSALRAPALRPQRTPRVVHVTPQHFGDEGLVGGGERYPTELARAMSGLTPTRLVGFGDHFETVREGALERVTLPVHPGLSRSSVSPFPRRFGPLLRDVDVVHLHQWETETSNLLTLLGALAQRRVFATDHGGWSVNHWRRLRLHRLLSGFLPVSEFSATFYPEMADRTTVILGGADPERYGAGLPLQDRSDEVLFVGRLLPHKGIDVFLSNLAPRIPVRIVGRAYDAAFHSRLQDLSAGRRVVIEEDASDERVLELLRRSRLLVLPSRYRPSDGSVGKKPELLGLALAEALACGTPVICCRTGGMPEVVRDGVTGFVVDENDPAGMRAAVDRLRDDHHLWQRFSDAARQDAVQRLTWTATARRCLAAYGASTSER